MMLSGFTTTEIVYLVIGALGIGFSKAGFPGVSMLHVILYASVFESRASTGIILPMLVIGDLCAIGLFGRKGDWVQIRRLLPPTLVGLGLGWYLMGRLNEDVFRVLVGLIILTLTAVQVGRMWRPHWFESFPHTRGFAVVLGLLAGLTTMLANAAGPVIGLYLLAVNLPKWELIGTSAWLFLVINVLKLPLSYNLDLITPNSLMINLTFAPMIPIGMLAGHWLVKRVSQVWFNGILLALTALGALRLLGVV
jgi:uncharacterized membrane protein YfcA